MPDEFLKVTKDDVKSYNMDENWAWPIMIDEFCEVYD
jgi:hypothetical protein